MNTRAAANDSLTHLITVVVFTVDRMESNISVVRESNEQRKTEKKYKPDRVHANTKESWRDKRIFNFYLPFHFSSRVVGVFGEEKREEVKKKKRMLEAPRIKAQSKVIRGEWSDCASERVKKNARKTQKCGSINFFFSSAQAAAWVEVFCREKLSVISGSFALMSRVDFCLCSELFFLVCAAM